MRMNRPSNNGQFIVPQPLRDKVLEEIHAGIMAGHLGEEKTLQQLKK